MTTIIINHDFVDGFIVKVKSDDQVMFKLAIDTLKSFVPASFRNYSPALKEWKVSEDAHDRFHRWLAYCRANLQAEVQWLDVGAGKESEHQQEWTPPSRQLTRAAALQVLHLRDTAPPELIRVVYKHLATTYHPDKGGDEEKMKAINAAYKQLAA